MQTIGVLGGLRPQATMDFEARVHQVAQRLILPRGNSGYSPMVVYYHRRPPFVMRADGTQPVLPLQLDPDLLQAAQWLGTRADFLVITANSPHVLQDQLAQAAGRPVLSMIEVTLAEIRQRGWQRIGVLGFREVSVYAEPLRRVHLTPETIGAGLHATLDASILALMEGRVSAESTATAREAVATLRARGVDGIILGCTEIPLLLGEDLGAPDLVNPAQLLAEAAVKCALEAAC
jgi:aspartate racemase